MGEDTVFVIPHEWNFCPRLCGTSAGFWEGIFQTVWQGKAGTIRNVHPGKGGKEAGGAALLTGLELRQGDANHCLEKGVRTFVHPLIQGFRRHCNLLPSLRGFRDSLRQCRRSVTPAPKGYEGQEEFARNFRRTPDKTRPTSCRFDLCGGKKFC